jgi:hypothetical protein
MIYLLFLNRLIVKDFSDYYPLKGYFGSIIDPYYLLSVN